MEYPKPVMRMSELRKMVFPETFLMQAYSNKNQNFAWKLDMAKSNSPILFDTEGFEQYRFDLIHQEKKANKIMRVI